MSDRHRRTGKPLRDDNELLHCCAQGMVFRALPFCLLACLQLQASSEYCTDSDCLRELPDPQSDSYAQLSSSIAITVGWVAVAAAMYYLRPNSLRGEPTAKPHMQNPANNNSRREDDDSSTN
jgi:hypothetical protein